ncbi:DUF2634 domain-containing protein [Anaerovibrio sp. RM50]|uniref:DUF2634 domain-containing protein n=1 Tax=Anaerovibrio sp. RM50 TaxID=1200557 RepID=UPI000489BBE8|nr:DUF2634 domain-containing protein [Anaerovibrio sp. RM50]
MAENLYPVVNLPTLIPPGQVDQEQVYKQSVAFDYDTGDFVLDGANKMVLASGKDTFIQWCLKQCVTERFTKLAYSNSVGVEIQEGIKSVTDVEGVESIIQRTVTEALMVNPITEYVREFEFQWDGSDSLYVRFVVKGKPWAEDITLTVAY